MKRRIRIRTVLGALLMLALLVVVLYPFIWLVLMSLRHNEDIMRYPPGLFVTRYTLRQFVEVFTRIPFGRFFLNTVIFAGSVSLISIFFDSMAGYAFGRLRFKGKNALFVIVLVGLFIPFQVIMIPLFVEVYKLRILNTYLALILPHCTSPFGIYFMRSFFVGLPRDLEESARIDGLNEFGVYRAIMLPLCAPALLTLFIFHFMYNWNDLLYPLMMTSSTNMRTLPAGLAMFIGQRVIEYGPTLAGSLLALAPLLIAYVFAQRYFVQSVAMTGLKA